MIPQRGSAAGLRRRADRCSISVRPKSQSGVGVDWDVNGSR